jgi:hypothetical protein
MEKKFNDRLLTDLLSRPDYIDDGGFTNRVTAALPPTRQKSYYRPVILMAASIIAGLVGLFLLPGGDLLTGALFNLMEFSHPEKVHLVSVIIVAAMAALPLAITEN